MEKVLTDAVDVWNPAPVTVIVHPIFTSIQKYHPNVI